jgi:two-component system cell cycle sensor histidine kinase/response regulator CckA
MKILHLEDNPRDATLVHDLLAAEWPDSFISVVATRDDFVALLKLGGYDLIISDYQLPGFNGLDALELVREMAPDTPFVFFSGTLGEESAIDAVRSGAADYVIKDRLQRLPMSVRRVMREASERRTRHRVEAALAQEQYLLRLMMENLPDRVYFKDLQSAFLAVSRSLSERVGLPPEQLKGKSDFDLFAPEHARKAFDDEQRIILTGQPLLNVEERENWPDGSVTWAATTKLPLRDHAGKIIGTFGISRDITARKQDEERMREQAEIINDAPIAIFITDLGNRITYCNEGAVKIYALRREEIVGRTADELLDAESAARLQAARVLARAHAHWSGVVPLTTRSGRSIQAELHLSQIADSAGQPRARLCIAIDVTEKKKFEEQFLRVQRLEGLGLLAAGIAHDLNNILSPILMGAPLLRMTATDPTEARMLEAIESSASRGAALVRQILSFAQGAGGGKAVVQPKYLLQDMTGFIGQTFPKSIRVDLDIPPDLWPVQGNSTQLHQVLLNLCVNARDAMPEGGTLRLRAANRVLDAAAAQAMPEAQPGSYLMIEVGDTGTGIPPEIVARVWEPFFTTKGEGKGTGLGLSTVRGIVASHDGFVVLDTALDRGTTFRVFLPAAEASAAVRHPAGTAHPFLSLGRGELVLVADDEQSIRDLIVAILSRSGYRVLAAADGREALALYEPRVAEVALVITDLGMPEMGGGQLAGRIRQLNPAAKLLFMSGAGTTGPADQAPAGSVTLPKPFTREDLLQAVRDLIGSAVS